ncbi:MAG: hypothetical protein IIA87_05150 [Nanoarchaeota archaeon]|nr:hypothetical protein [Nanoarchaeota archaeon]
MAPHVTHPLDIVPIREGDEEMVRESLRLLPENTFNISFLERFVRGIPIHGEHLVGQIGIYAKKEPIMGDRSISLVIVNEHLFGDPTDQGDAPLLRIPDGASYIIIEPARMPPLKEDQPFAGVSFNYREARFFFGYELSSRAVETILNRRR